MGAFGVNKSKMSADAQKMLDRFDLGIDAESLIADLSIAQQQMVEIVKAISFNCRILVMDEPTSSISDREVNALFEIMHNLAAQGVGIILHLPQDERAGRGLRPRDGLARRPATSAPAWSRTPRATN